ncbi:MAG: M48 family metallopeptidase [Bacteroidales bacterium]|nr:M48 family metallopeptidase [Bacteroidales bacterium]
MWRIIRRRPRRKPVSSPEVLRLRAEAEEYLPQRLSELSRQTGLEYNKVRIKHNVSNWGSCSSKKNINLNLNIMRLPPELQDYVMLHELCHLRHMNHGPEFHALLESLCPGHREKQRRLKEYKLI